MTRTVNRITDEAALRALIGGEPTATVTSKIADHVNEVTARFIEASPFVCVATCGGDGDGLDVSPRGIRPGSCACSTSARCSSPTAPATGSPTR